MNTLPCENLHIVWSLTRIFSQMHCNTLWLMSVPFFNMHIVYHNGNVKQLILL